MPALSYYELQAGGAPITTRVRFYATHQGFDATHRIDFGWGETIDL